MIGILQSVYDRKTGKLIKKEIIEVLDMSEDEYYAPLIETLGNDFLKKLAEETNQRIY